MKNVVTGFLILFVAISCSSCGSTSNKNNGNSAIVTALDCTAKGIASAAASSLPKVEQALLAGDWATQLEQIGAQIGKDVLACIVEHVVTASTTDLKASPDQNAATKSSRGQIWLRGTGATFSKEPG